MFFRKPGMQESEWFASAFPRSFDFRVSMILVPAQIFRAPNFGAAKCQKGKDFGFSAGGWRESTTKGTKESVAAICTNLNFVSLVALRG